MVEVAQQEELYSKPYKEGRPPQMLAVQHDNSRGDPVFSMFFKYASDGRQSGIADPKVDEMIAKATAATGEERTKDWQELFAYLHDEVVPDVLLFHMVELRRGSATRSPSRRRSPPTRSSSWPTSPSSDHGGHSAGRPPTLGDGHPARRGPTRKAARHGPKEDAHAPIRLAYPVELRLARPAPRHGLLPVAAHRRPGRPLPADRRDAADDRALPRAARPQRPADRPVRPLRLGRAAPRLRRQPAPGAARRSTSCCRPSSGRSGSRVITMALVTAAAIVIGSLAAFRPGGVFDRIVTFTSLIGASAPDFWIAIVGITVFAIGLGWLPDLRHRHASGTGSCRSRVLFIRPFGLILQVVRGSMVQAFGSAYVKTARAKGVSDRSIIFVHTLRNAMLPVITVDRRPGRRAPQRRGGGRDDLRLPRRRQADDRLDPHPRLQRDPGRDHGHRPRDLRR